MMRKVQLLSERVMDNRPKKAKCLLNKLKHKEETGMLLFSSDEKTFVQFEKVKYEKIGDCANPGRGSDCHAKTIYSLSDDSGSGMRYEDDLMPLHCHFQCARVNPDK